MLVNHLSFAAIYKWVDVDGNIYFTDSPPKNTKSRKVTVKTNTYQSTHTIQPKQKSNVTSNSKASLNNKTVIMYSAEWCGVCRKAKRYFKQKGIAYTNLDIDKNRSARQRYNALNASGIPIIFIDNTRLNGFTARHFEQVYNR